MDTRGDCGGPGERLVQLLSCVDRFTDRAERVLPSVDHLAMQRRTMPPSDVLSALGRSGPAELIEPFEAWQRLLQDFDAAVARLVEVRDGDEGGGSDYQARLGAGVAEARRCRHAVEEAAEDLRRRVAAVIDAGLAHGEGRHPLPGVRR